MNASTSVSVEGEEEDDGIEALMSRGLARHHRRKNLKGEFNGSEEEKSFHIVIIPFTVSVLYLHDFVFQKKQELVDTMHLTG